MSRSCRGIGNTTNFQENSGDAHARGALASWVISSPGCVGKRRTPVMSIIGQEPRVLSLGCYKVDVALQLKQDVFELERFYFHQDANLKGRALQS